MERRRFLRTMLGVAAATALPSEVWPFKKIFLPPAPSPELIGLDGMNYSVSANTEWLGLSRSPYPGRLPPFPGTVTSEFSRQLLEEEVEAIELEVFAKEIPNLFFAANPLYELYRKEVLALPSRRSLLHSPATPENVMKFIDSIGEPDGEA